MENASKALIIAGAILLSILIIAIGMYIYNSSTSSIYTAGDQISQQEKEVFNTQWTKYEENQPGSSVRQMISSLISNAQKNGEEQTKLPDLGYVATAGSEANYVISTVSGGGEGGAADDHGINQFSQARTSIETKHTYYVELHYNSRTALVDSIFVHYNKPAAATLVEDVDDTHPLGNVDTPDEPVEPETP